MRDTIMLNTDPTRQIYAAALAAYCRAHADLESARHDSVRVEDYVRARYRYTILRQFVFTRRSTTCA